MSGGHRNANQLILTVTGLKPILKETRNLIVCLRVRLRKLEGSGLLIVACMHAKRFILMTSQRA